MLPAVAWRAGRSGPCRPATVAGASVVTFDEGNNGKCRAECILPNSARKRLRAGRWISATSAVATEVRSGSVRLAPAYTEVEFTLTALAAVEAVTALPAAASTAVGAH